MTLEIAKCSSESNAISRLKSRLDDVMGFCQKKWRTQNLSDKNKQAYLRLEIEAIKAYGSLTNQEILDRLDKLESTILEQQNFR